MSTIHYKQAKKISYGAERSLKNVTWICFHYTGNVGDSAAGNASYFSRHGDGNTRYAGAHYFIDQQGVIYQTIGLNYTAWAVGGFVTKANGAASLYGKCTNSNSVSIELCDCATKDPSAAMIASVKQVIKAIRKQCPNATKTARHWDISGKQCPARMTGDTEAGRKRWANFLKAIGEASPTATAVAKKPTYPTITLKYGMTGEQVKRLQKCLNKIIKAGLAVDGSFGAKTLAAVKKFQKKYGLEVDGIVGTITRAKIKSLI